MCSPLPLRLWCMAAMAPALTEAATQAHIKLPPLSPPASTDCNLLLNGRDKTIGLKAQLTGSIAKLSPDKGLKKPTTLPDLPYLEKNVNGELGKPVVSSTSISTAGGSINLKVVRSLPPTNPYGLHKLTLPKDSGVGSLLNKNRLMNRPSLLSSSSSQRGNSSADSGTTESSGTNTPQRPYLNSKLQGNIGRSIGGEILMKTSLPVVNNMSTVTFDKPFNEGIVSEPGRSVESGLDLHSAQQQVMKFQCFLGKKVNTLMKRLRRIQGKQLEQHIRRQLAGFVNKQHKNLQSMAKSIKSPNPGLPVPSTGLQTELLQSEDVRHLSTAALVNLVRKLQSPQPISIGQRLMPNASKVDSNSILKLDKETSVESERVACQLNTVLRHMESALDSDATESSSGGESCDDECEPDASEKEKKSQQMSLHRRAEWKWAFDRSAIAFRWTWLQAQVSDLEYRIRQQSEVHKQIRSNKGAVNFDSLFSDSERMARLCKSRTGKPTEGENNKNDFSNINNTFLQTSKFTSPLTNIIPPGLGVSASLDKPSGETTSTKSLNGLIDTHSGNISDSPTNATSTNLKKNDSERVSQNLEQSCLPAVPVDITCQAARCRPVKSYRKRKILRTTGLHLLSQKATRLSTVKCHCYAPVIPCAMCGGRYNNTQHLDPDVMPLHERVSLLDPAFHPVLSFSQEIPLPVHFEALLKSGEWQNKPPPKPAKTTANDRRRQKILQQNEARRTSKKLKNAAAVLLSSAKFRSRYDKKPVQKSRPSTTSAAVNPMSLAAQSTSSSLPPTPQNKVTDKRLCRTEIKKRRAAQLAIALKKFPSRSISLGGNRLSGKRRFRSSDQAFLKAGSINFPSATFKEMKEATLRKRRGESAFDINNIVIPYSMAASTRVEKLQYKEIVTPKWRKIVQESSVSEDKAEVEESLASSTNPSLLSNKKPPTSNQSNGIIPACQNKEEEEGAAVAAVVVEEDDKEEEAAAEDDDDELEIEDLSDELYIQRHAKCETQEKKRFVSFFKHGRRGHRSVRSDDTEPVSPESVGALDSSSMIGSPIHPTTSSSSSRHGPCADALVSTLSSQSPSPLPALLPLQDRSTSLNHPSPNNKLHSELTENQSLLTLDETDKMKHGRGLSCNQRHIELEESDSPFTTAGFKQQQEPQSCLKSDGLEEGVTSSHLLSQTASHLVHRSQSPLLSKISQNAAALSAGHHPSIQSFSPHPSPIDSSFQPRPLTPTTFHPTTHLQKFCDEQLGRRRCSSLSKHERSCYEDDSDLFDMVEHLTVEPWIPRTFPLTEVEYETMRIEHCKETKKPIETVPETSHLESRTPGGSHPCSPLPSSSSASNAEEDPNDPEWKVIGSKSGIVLRLAKR